MKTHTEDKNLNKQTKKESKPNMQKCNNWSCVCVSLCTTVVQNTAQSSSDYLPSYPPDKHQISDAVYWRGGGVY